MTENQLGIEVKGLQKIFKIDNVQACKDVNLSINHGEFMILLGPSGCGKTTISNLVLLLHEPTDGGIFFRDKPMTDLSNRERPEYARHVQVELIPCGVVCRHHLALVERKTLPARFAATEIPLKATVRRIADAAVAHPALDR